MKSVMADTLSDSLVALGRIAARGLVVASFAAFVGCSACMPCAAFADDGDTVTETTETSAAESEVEPGAQADNIAPEQDAGSTSITNDDGSTKTVISETIEPVASDGHDFRVYGDHIDLQLFSEQQILNLPTSGVTYYFNIPEGISLTTPCVIDLYVTTSDTLIDELSSIGVSVNGEILETIPIRSIGDHGNGWWNIEIPLNSLEIGSMNSITFESHHRSIEGECADIDNPSNWVAFGTSSTFRMSVASYPECTLASFYPLFFDSVLANPDYAISFFTDDTAASQGSALRSASALGAYKRYVGDIDLSLAQSMSTANILVGSDSSWNSLFDNLDMSGMLAGQGYLATSGTIGDGTSRLLVTGGSEAGLERAADLASHPGYMQQLIGNSTVVSSDIENEPEVFETNEDGIYTFEDMGYETTTLAGAFHQTASFDIVQPNNTQCGPASTVTINFSHSRALQADRSLLTVYIDDVAIDSVQLSDSNAVDGTITVAIPEESRENSMINVRVDVYNYIGKIDCSKDYYDVAWTVIDESSSVFLDPSDLAIRPKLSDMFAFNMWAETAESTVVVRTDNFNSAVLNSAMRIGQANNHVFDFTVEGAQDAVSELDKANNIVIIGSTSTINIPDEIAAEMDAVPQADGTYEISENVPFINETLNGKVVFQALRSPYNFDKYVYVVSHPDGKEDLALSALCEGDIFNALSGTIAAVGSDGVVWSYDSFIGSTGEEAPLSVELVQYKVQETLNIPLWVLIALVILVILIIILIVRLVLRRSQFKKMERRFKEVNGEEAPVPDNDRASRRKAGKRRRKDPNSDAAESQTSDSSAGVATEGLDSSDVQVADRRRDGVSSVNGYVDPRPDRTNGPNGRTNVITPSNVASEGEDTDTTETPHPPKPRPKRAHSSSMSESASDAGASSSSLREYKTKLKRPIHFKPQGNSIIIDVVTRDDEE